MILAVEIVGLVVDIEVEDLVAVGNFVVEMVDC